MVSKLLGDDAPGCLWAKGNLELLSRPMISLVGSRDIMPRNLEFARELGRQAALQGFVLVSGNARGADRAAQSACLEAGGADVETLRGRTHHGADALDVRVPAALRAAVGVRDAVTEARSLAADVASGSHGVLLGSVWCGGRRARVRRGWRTGRQATSVAYRNRRCRPKSAAPTRGTTVPLWTRAPGVLAGR